MRAEPPLEGDERSMLVGWLDFHRETLAIKVDGLGPEQFSARPIANSATSLLGLVRHLTEIERTYFRRVFAGEELPDLPLERTHLERSRAVTTQQLPRPRQKRP